MDFDACIYEFHPVFQVSRAPIDLVDDHALSRSRPQQSHHFGEGWSALVRSALSLFEPAYDLQSVLARESLDGLLLFGERDSPFTLSGGRHPGVRKEYAHGA